MVTPVMKTLPPDGLDGWICRFPEEEVGFDGLRQHLAKGRDTSPSLKVVVPPDLERAVLATGMIDMGGGVAEVWMVTAPGFERFIKSALRLLPKYIGITAKAFQFHRVHTLVASDFAGAKRFARLVGFEFEATLKQIGPNRADYDMMIWKG